MDDEAQEAIDQANRIRESIEDAPEDVRDRAAEFFESVDSGVRDVAATIEHIGRVTPAQQRALDNWESGVNRWINNSRE